MIKLERHIELLLLSNDCVIVPDLGGFMAHDVCAYYDEEEQMFLPPRRTLGFNPQLKLNDSLLAQSYVEAYDISYPEAIERIADEVRELKQYLDNDGRYELSNIGELYVNDEGKLAFEPCEAGLLTPELYGLGAFSFATLLDEEPIANQQTEKKEKAKPKDADKEEEVNKALKNIVVDNDSVFMPEEDDERTIKIKVSWIRNTVIAAAAVILLFIIATPLSDFKKSGLSISHIGNEIFSSMIPKDTSKGDITPKLVKDTAVKHVEKKNVSIPIVKADSNTVCNVDSSRFCIVLASRITRKNANRFVSELQDAGITDAQTYVHNDIVRVVYGHFATEKDAQDSLRKMRDNSYFEEAWVYEK